MIIVTHTHTVLNVLDRALSSTSRHALSHIHNAQTLLLSGAAL